MHHANAPMAHVVFAHPDKHRTDSYINAVKDAHQHFQNEMRKSQASVGRDRSQSVVTQRIHVEAMTDNQMASAFGHDNAQALAASKWKLHQVRSTDDPSSTTYYHAVLPYPGHYGNVHAIFSNNESVTKAALDNRLGQFINKHPNPVMNVYIRDNKNPRAEGNVTGGATFEHRPVLGMEKETMFGNNLSSGWQIYQIQGRQKSAQGWIHRGYRAVKRINTGEGDSTKYKHVLLNKNLLFVH